MHSTEPVFRGGCDWVSERGLPVRELQDKGVVFVVHNICELALDDACAFVEVLGHDDAHVLERQKLLDVILDWDEGNWCFFLKHPMDDCC